MLNAYLTKRFIKRYNKKNTINSGEIEMKNFLFDVNFVDRIVNTFEESAKTQTMKQKSVENETKETKSIEEIFDIKPLFEE